MKKINLTPEEIDNLVYKATVAKCILVEDGYSEEEAKDLAYALVDYWMGKYDDEKGSGKSE
jgi:hypothetical protein